MSLGLTGHMVLYKYYSWEAWINIVSKSKKVRFSNPHYFNDPFETQAADHPLSNTAWFEADLERFSGIRENVVVFCLTRNPLNSLMWSHYGESHRGVVVGFDMVAMGFYDKKKCVLPCQFGNVIYTNTKPKGFYSDSFNDGVFSLQGFDPMYLEALQRNYLYKSQEWAYEEEVRVVCHREALGGEKKQAYETFLDVVFDPAAVRELYFGWRCQKDRKSPRRAMKQVAKRMMHEFPNVELRVVEPERDTWQLSSHRLSDDFFDF
ncbi:DUF2971 domain-containing protein [Chromobacterium subtsugae]|uniref:DUF2971 domain-containing protein n=1 Tax=Chromobacterium subtsugae TaxID=251747 RepID=UPI0009BC5137|nr:DUF2971 domain-containing protein [Chromobacterium subtsugae]